MGIGQKADTHAPPVVGSATAVLSLTAAVLLILAPLPDGPLKSVLVPNIVLIPVFFLTLRPKEKVGPIGAFSAGLAVDILTFGALGVTAASLLLIHFVLRQEREALIVLPAGFRLGAYVLSAAFLLSVSFASLEWLGPGAPPTSDFVAAFAALVAIGLTTGILLKLVDVRRGAAGMKERLPGKVKRQRAKVPSTLKSRIKPRGRFLAGRG